MSRALGALVLLVSLQMGAQTLSVRSCSIPGLELTGPQSPDFNGLVTAIVGPDRPSAFAASLPYGVVVRNRTRQPLAAIEIVWTADGRTNPVLLDAQEQWFTMPQNKVQPGGSVLAIPAGIMQSPRHLRIFQNGSTSRHRLENFAAARNVTVAVDAVVYASGQFAGADTYGAFERWQAEINAPRTLAAAVLQRRATQSIGEIVAWIDALAADRRAQDPQKQETSFAARVLFDAYQNHGEAEFYRRAQAMAQRSPFPLHR